MTKPTAELKIVESIENSNTNVTSSNNILLALNENDELSQQSTDKEVIYVTYRNANINDESKMLHSADSVVQAANLSKVGNSSFNYLFVFRQLNNNITMYF